MRWLSPSDIQTTFGIKKTMTYELLKEYEAEGGEVVRIGKLRRVSEELFTNFLRERSRHETQS
jgi:hypothetical protein